MYKVNIELPNNYSVTLSTKSIKNVDALINK